MLEGWKELGSQGIIYDRNRGMDPGSDPFRIPSYSPYKSFLRFTLNLISQLLTSSDLFPEFGGYLRGGNGEFSAVS